eukprot:scaffold201597_cov37-Prasinocladus_malaysianus.AAC.2
MVRDVQGERGRPHPPAESRTRGPHQRHNHHPKAVHLAQLGSGSRHVDQHGGAGADVGSREDP